MNRFAILFLAFAALLFPAFCSADDSDPLAELRNRWVVAVREGDAARAASVFAEDGTLMPPGFPSFVGRKAIESFYRDGFALASVSAFEVHPEAHRAGGRTYREHGTYKVTWQPKDATAPYTLVGRYMLIASKHADGKWQFLWEMHTIEPKVPPDQL
ncbi:MAG TPA: nuclear transport factor 2 family protein [Methylomirabilota bacterium]|nr:nuclear transport factor 2 family protein [Methylomirabilota bacterium]